MTPGIRWETNRRILKPSASAQTRHETGLALTRVDGLKRRRQSWPVLAKRDLPKLRRLLPLRRTDLMRFYSAYLGSERMTLSGRALLRELVAKQVTQ